jgi:hypothetical protein
VTKTTRKARAKARPITAHRLFPAFAGLWFAALLGLVSFVVPVELLQRAVVASGLPHLVAAAAPPLGFTARALVALLLTGFGGVLGLVLGWRLGRAIAFRSIPRRRWKRKTPRRSPRACGPATRIPMRRRAAPRGQR